MPNFLILYVSTLVPMLIVDSIWLVTMSKYFYADRLAHLLAGGFKLGPAIVFYLMYAAGVVVLVSAPQVASGGSLMKVFLLGALLGLLAYGAYDLTNQATLKDWPIAVTIVDMAWGMIMTGTTATIGVYLAKLFN